MITAELIDYIKARLAAGLNNETIIKELMEVGWQQSDIEEGFKNLNSPSALPSEASAPQIQVGGLLSVGQLLTETWSMYKRLFGKLILISLIYCLTVPLLLVIIEMLVIAGSIGTVFSVFSGFLPVNFTTTIVGFILIFIFGVFAYLVMFYISMTFTAAIIIVLKEKGQISLGGALKQGLKKAFPLIWMGILSGLIILGASLLLVIPGFFVSVSIALAMMVVIIEDKKGLSAIQKIRDYVDGKWFYVFVRLLVFTIIIGAISTVPTVLGGFWKNKIIDVAVFLYSLLSIIFIFPLSSINGYLIYISLKNYKSGLPEKKSRKRSLVAFLILGLVAPILLILVIFAGGFFLSSTIEKGLNFNLNYNFNTNYNYNTNRNANLNSNSNLNNNANAAVTFDDKYKITESKLSQAGLNEAEIKYNYIFTDSIQQIIKNKNDENFVLENNVYKTSERAKAQYDTIKESITSKTDTTSIMDLIGLGVEAQSIERQTSQTIKTGYGYLVLTDKSVIEVYFTSAYFSKVQDLIKLVGS